MKATLMDEVRTKRGLAYGAYMGIVPRRGPSAVRGWVFTGTDRTVNTLKLILRLYKGLMKDGLSPERLRFFQSFVTGTYASDMDAPEHRLGARVSAEIDGLPEDFVDTYVERVKAVTPEQVDAAIRAHVRAGDMAITMVATADTVLQLLIKSGLVPGNIDVVKYDTY
jgi:zinc protease